MRFTFVADGLKYNKVPMLDAKAAKRPESTQSAGPGCGAQEPRALLSSNLQMKGGSKWLRSS